MSMNDDGAELVLDWYQDLEARFRSILSTVPIRSDTERVFLPSLSGLILEACSILDAVFRDGIQPASAAKTANMPAYALYFEPLYVLSATRSVFYQHPAQLICPFQSWQGPDGSYQPLGWWQNYNSLKHDRLKHFELSTFATARDALGALHQVIAKVPDFLQALIRRDMIFFGRWNPDYVLDILRGNSPLDDAMTVLIESELFGTPAGASRFPNSMAEVEPWRFSMGRKLWRHINSRM